MQDASRNLNLDTIVEEPQQQARIMSDGLDHIYKALRLIPEFDGNVNVLTRFIKLCDQIVNEYLKEDPVYALSNLALLNGILNKITGPAARLINSNGIPDNWAGIRSALINNFADQRDETSLYNDLALLSQGPSSPQEFYEKCQNLFSTIMTYVSLHEGISSTIESKRSLYKKLTLQSYLRGLRDPLGSRIRCMRPDTMEKALEFVHEEENTLYLQQRNEHLPERRQMQPQVSQPKYSFMPPMAMLPPRPFVMQPMQPTQAPRPFSLPGPSHAHPQRTLPAYRPPAPQYRGPTRTQQIFGAAPPNYRPQSNVFKLSPRNASIGPQPMSGVSHYVTKPFPAPNQVHDWSKFGNPQPSNYFKTREAHFNEFYNQPSYHDLQTDYYDYQSDYYYPDFAYDFSYEQQPPYTDGYCVEEVQEATPSTEKKEEDFQKPFTADKLK